MKARMTGGRTGNMNQRRVVAVLVFFFAVTFCIVHLEGQKIRHARQIARLNRQLLEFDYQSWQAKASLAKLCSPAQLRQRSERMALGTMPPESIVEMGSRSGEELAADLRER